MLDDPDHLRLPMCVGSFLVIHVNMIIVMVVVVDGMEPPMAVQVMPDRRDRQVLMGLQTHA